MTKRRRTVNFPIEQDNFTLTVSDDKGFASLNGTSTDQRIRAHGTRHFTIRVNIPEGQKEGSASKITISGRSRIFAPWRGLVCLGRRYKKAAKIKLR